MLRQQFGKKLALLRRELNMTQEQLAEASGLSAGFIRSIEQGVYAPSFESLEILAKVLNVTVKELFNFDSRNED